MPLYIRVPFFSRGNYSTTRLCRPKVRTASQESSHNRCRGLQMPPARLTAARSSLSFQPIRTPTRSRSLRRGLRARLAHATSSTISSAVLMRLPVARSYQIADADQPLAITSEQPLCARHTGTQRQPDFHRTLRPLNARGGEPCAGRGSDGFLLYHTASLRGSHLEGRSVRIRPRRFARRDLR